jgi:hypothetical protein
MMCQDRRRIRLSRSAGGRLNDQKIPGEPFDFSIQPLTFRCELACGTRRERTGRGLRLVRQLRDGSLKVLPETLQFRERLGHSATMQARITAGNGALRRLLRGASSFPHAACEFRVRNC